jgi:hypothetical protein
LPAKETTAGPPTPAEIDRATEARRRIMHRLKVMPALHQALGEYHKAIGKEAPDEAARRRARVAVLNTQTWALEDYHDYVARAIAYLQYKSQEDDARQLQYVHRAIDLAM